MVATQSWRKAVALAGGFALVAGCSSSHGGANGAGTTTRPIVTVSVVDGLVRRSVQVRQGDPLTKVLAAARVLPSDGRLLSVVTHRPVGVAEPARLTLAGRPVSVSSPVGAGTLVITNGVDRVEPTVTAREATVPPGRPKALQFVYSAGRPGTADVTRGKVSGEVVSQQVLTPGLPSVRDARNVIALTFDDGPSIYTAGVLDVLKAKGVHATFCLIGRQVAHGAALVRRELAEGNQICNHTLDHDEHLATASPARIDEEVQGGIEAIVKAGFPKPSLYRPPAGSLSPAVYAGAAARQEQVLYWWGDPEDYTRPPVDQIVNKVLARVRPGAIILMHDGGGNRVNTIAALPIIIDKIRALGYTFTFPLD